MLRNLSQNPLQPLVRNFVEDRPPGEVVGQDQVPGEGLREGLVELEHVLELLDVDEVDVAVGEGPQVDGRLGQRVLPPLSVAKHVALTQEGQDLSVLEEIVFFKSGII